MQSDWKRVIWPLIVLVMPGNLYAGAFTVGFNFILQSRFGLTVGYFFTDNLGAEVHFGGLKRKMVRYGMSLIAMPTNYDNNFYFLFGYATGPRSGLFTKGELNSYESYYSPLYSAETHDRGFNIALGYDMNFTDTKWHVPLEAGIYLITHSELIEYEDSEMLPQKVYVGREKERRKPFIVPLVGFGLRWHADLNH